MSNMSVVGTNAGKRGNENTIQENILVAFLTRHLLQCKYLQRGQIVNRQNRPFDELVKCSLDGENSRDIHDSKR